jgi:hypothetical protein
MWAKNLLVAGFAVLTAVAAPASTDVVREAYTGNAILVPIQDRGEARRCPPLGAVLAQLRARYGGAEFLDARPVEGGPCPVYEIRFRMPNGEIRVTHERAAR